MKKRIISFFTALSMTLMLFTSMPTSVSAVTIVANGTCGAEGNEDNVTWTLDSDGVLTISGTGEMKSSPDWSIYNSDINTLVIQNGVTNIGESAFRNCKKITSATIPNGVTNIGKYAFYYCDELETVYCAESVSEIKNEAFTGCWKLKYLFVNHDTKVSGYGISTTAALIVKYDHHGADKYKVTEIKQNSSSATIEITDDMNIDFVAPSSRKNVAKTGHTHIYENGMCNICGDIASGTAEITGDGFSYEIATGKLTVTSNGGTTAWKDYDYILDKESVKSAEIKDTVTRINAEAFADCENLTSVSIAENVIEIGESAFENCEKLESVIIPEISGLKVIGENAFCYCNHLTEIYIPDTVTEIGMTAFAGTGLTAIPRLPDGITHISDGMFMECRSLMSAEIPESVVSIGGMAFAICPKLEYALYPAGAALGNEVFYSVDEEWNETESTVTQLKYETGGDKRRITEIILGSGKTDVTVTDEMNVNFVNENERSKVSQEGHTHVDVNNICQICNAAISSHTHKACADSSHENCTHSEVEYEPFPTTLDAFKLDLKSIIIKDDKNYYLTDDLTDGTFTDIQICIIGANVNFCLNGHALEVKDIRVSDNGELNVCDCKTDGCFTSNYNSYGLLETRTGGTLNIYNGKISSVNGIAVMCGDPDEDSDVSVTNIYGGEINGGIMVNNGDALSVYGGIIENVTDDYRIGIHVLNDATVNINGGTIVGRTFGVAATYRGSTVNINGGSVEGIDKAALYIQNGVICNITGGAVASTEHSAVYTLDEGVVNINGGNLTSTSFPTVWIDNNGIANISGGNISNQGYSSYIWNSGTLNISGGVFTSDRDKIGYIRNFNNFSLRGNSILINTGIWLDSNDDSEKNITIDGALTNTEAYPIYITGYLPRTFTSGWDTYMTDKNTSKYFKSPYDNSKIVYRDNEAVMVYYYKITYDANGGSCTIGSAEADASDKLTSLATPTRDGYSFVGWFTEADGGKKITTDTVFTNDATIYAHWTCNDHIWGDTYEKDEDCHWQICTRCNAESEKTGHTWDEGEETTPPTETTEGVMLYTCTVCKATKTEPKAPLDHTHDWSDEWSKDDTYHWHDCLKNCGEKKDNAAHIWDNGTVTNQPTAEDEGEKTYECTVCGKTKTETLPPKDEPSEPDSGNISVDVQPGENAPNTELKTPFDELAGAVLTPEEQENIKNGIDIKIILSVSNAAESVPTDDKAKIEAAIRGLTDYKLGQYLDLNLLKIIGNSEGVKITQTNRPITVTFEIPAALRGKAEYSVIRVHNGTAAVLRDLDSAPDTVTIETDKFSTYALAYREKTTTSNPSGGNSSGGNPGGGSNPPTSTPGEGDNSDAASSDDGNTTSSESDTSSNVSNHSPSESSPSEDNGNPSTGIAVSLIPLVTAAAILTVAVKRKKK